MDSRQIIILLILLFEVTQSIILGTRNLSKQFLKNSIKGKGWGFNVINTFGKSTSNQFYALKNVTITLNNNITAFIGPSGSGKSTLAKCLIGKEIYDSGEVVYNNYNNNKNLVAAYLDHLFRQSYDENFTIEQIFNVLYENNVKDYKEFRSYKELMNIVNLPLNEKVSTLLESQRKVFEVTYGLLKAELNIIINNINNNNDENENEKAYIIVLDEYLDKDVASVRSKFYNMLKMLSHSTTFQLQVIIITHSKAVLNSCCDKVIILKDGRVYSEGDSKKKIAFPAQLQMLD